MHEYKVDVAKSARPCSRIGGRARRGLTSVHADTDPDKLARDLRKLAFLAIRWELHRVQSVVLEPHRQGFPRSISCPGRTAPTWLAIDAFDVIASGAPLDDIDAVFTGQILPRAASVGSRHPLA
jgi:hypothetical protein